MVGDFPLAASAGGLHPNPPAGREGSEQGWFGGQ